jgi:hypothetical protein
MMSLQQRNNNNNNKSKKYNCIGACDYPVPIIQKRDSRPIYIKVVKGLYCLVLRLFAAWCLLLLFLLFVAEVVINKVIL